VFLPLRFLLLVAKGQAFNDETIGSLHFLAWFLLITGIVIALIKIIFHLFFQSMIPPQIRFSWYDALMNGWEYIIAGLIALLLAKAFLKGSQLQKDSELTV